MNVTQHIPLPDGRRMEVDWLTYPIPPAAQTTLIELWRTEWSRTDFDWLEAMHGDYSDTLTIHSVIGRVEGHAAGTASVYYANTAPEVGLVGNVVTHPDYRRLGIARQLTDLVVQRAFADGSQVCYLGTRRSERCVYLNCGFDWVSGGVMRRPAAGASDAEQQIFAPGQRTTIRGAVWGDMPGLACLVAQPLDTVMIDYLRGLVSRSHVPMTRCVSNFPAIWYDIRQRGGVMRSVIGETEYRVLGFGSVTPAPGSARRHIADIDLCLHDHYHDDAPAFADHLVAGAKNLGFDNLRAFVAATDRHKLAWFQNAGFQRVAELSNDLRLGDRTVNTLIMTRGM